MTEKKEILKLIQEKNDYYINYIEGISGVTCRKDAKHIFNVYAENKGKLFKALGNKLSVSKDIHIKMDKTLMVRNLNDFYNPVEYLYYDEDLYSVNNSFFICDVINFIYNHFSSRYRDRSVYDGSKRGEAEDLLEIFGYILRHDNMYNQKTSDFKWLDIASIDKKLVKFPEGMRPMRALRKFLEYINYPNMKLFDDFRNKVSYILTNKEVFGTINISIDPIDFISLSNNNSNWGSCMRIPEGSYCQSVTSMMNSPYALVAYFTNNDKKFIVNDIEYPNKTWRVLLFFDVEKDMWICNNKEYPYHSSQLLEEVFSFFREILKNNMNLEFLDPVWNSAYYNIGAIATEYYGEEVYDEDDEEYDEFYYSEGENIERFGEDLESGIWEAKDWMSDHVPLRKVALETTPYYNDLFNNPTDEFPKIALNVNCPANFSEYADVAGEVTCLFCGSKRELCTYYMQRYGLDNYENNLGLCYKCNEYNKSLAKYEVPVITWIHSFTRLKEDLRNYLINNNENYSEKKLAVIINDNIMVDKPNDPINKIVRHHIPLMKFNDKTFSLVSYIQCKDDDETILNLFTTMNNVHRVNYYRIGFYKKTSDKENQTVIAVEDVSPLDIVYMHDKFGEKYSCCSRWGEVLHDNGESSTEFFDMILPLPLRKYLGMMEVTDDRETKLKALQSIQNLRSSR